MMSDPLEARFKVSWKAIASDDKEYGNYVIHTGLSLDEIPEAIDLMKENAVNSLIKSGNTGFKKLTITIENHSDFVEEFTGTNPS